LEGDGGNMSRLFDRIVRGEGIFNSEKIKKQSDDLPVIDVFDTVDLFYNHEKCIWSLEGGEDFPNLAPVFEEYFLESKVPKTYRTPDKVVATDSEINSFGCLVSSKKVEDGWKTSYLMFVEREKGRVISPIEFMVNVDKNGIIIGAARVGYDPNKVNKNGLGMLTSIIVLPMLFSNCFLHCKNVELVDNHPPEKSNRKHIKRYGVPMTKYYTLHIEPMKQILKTEGNSEENGLQKALHICRGHFKDYREGKGLFGRHKEIYWWDNQVRGTLDRGRIKKDYKLKI
jgi:hypothetical protein